MTTSLNVGFPPSWHHEERLQLILLFYVLNSSLVLECPPDIVTVIRFRWNYLHVLELSGMKLIAIAKIFFVGHTDQTLIFCFLLEYKKARQEIKKKSSDTLKLQKKAKKGNSKNSAPDIEPWGKVPGWPGFIFEVDSVHFLDFCRCHGPAGQMGATVLIWTTLASAEYIGAQKSWQRTSRLTPVPTLAFTSWQPPCQLCFVNEPRDFLWGFGIIQKSFWANILS